MIKVPKQQLFPQYMYVHTRIHTYTHPQLSGIHPCGVKIFWSPMDIHMYLCIYVCMYITHNDQGAETASLSPR